MGLNCAYLPAKPYCFGGQLKLSTLLSWHVNSRHICMKSAYWHKVAQDKCRVLICEYFLEIWTYCVAMQ